MISKAVIANINSHNGTEVHGHMLVTFTSLMTWVGILFNESVSTKQYSTMAGERLPTGSTVVEL